MGSLLIEFLDKWKRCTMPPNKKISPAPKKAKAVVATCEDEWAKARGVCQHAATSSESDLLSAVRFFRKQLSQEQNPPLDRFLSDNLLSILVPFLHSNAEGLKFEVAWCLTNVASGDSSHVAALLSANVHLELVNHIVPSEAIDVVEQVIWCLANIAGDGAGPRDTLLDPALSLLPKLSAVFDPNMKAPVVENISFLLSNLCRGKPPPELDLIMDALPILARILRECGQNQAAQVNALWALSYLSDGDDSGDYNNPGIDALLQSNVIDAVIDLLLTYQPPPPPPFGPGNPLAKTHECQEGRKITVGLVSDMLSFLNTEELRRVAFTCKEWFYDVLCEYPPLYRRARRPMEHTVVLQVPALRICGNIAAGSDAQTDVLVRKGFVALLETMLQSTHESVRKDAAWSLSNIVAGTQLHIDEFLSRKECVNIVVRGLFEERVVIRRELAWVVGNIFIQGSPSQVSRMLAAGGLHGLVAVYGAVSKTERLFVDALSAVMLRAASESDENALAAALTASLERKEAVVLSHEQIAKIPQDELCDAALYMAKYGIPSLLARVRPSLLRPIVGMFSWTSSVRLEDYARRDAKGSNKESEGCGIGAAVGATAVHGVGSDSGEVAEEDEESSTADDTSNNESKEAVAMAEDSDDGETGEEDEEG